MYIPRALLILLVIIYFLFLLSIDWVSHSEGAWYRPFFLGALIVAFASWVHRKRNTDEF
ncbi:MAG: hypothetical protein OXE78_12410 [Gammaproteobacteria bacterium]|nr:hypothetical protein [Gammaproteobacteria bacterium]MCY4358429.1 hypothetical protein [Gammaproteobacteria bacterium]